MTTNQSGTLHSSTGLGFGLGFQTVDRYGASGLAAGAEIRLPTGREEDLLGSGELGREFVISAKRLGAHVIACDSYAGAPAMQVADAFWEYGQHLQVRVLAVYGGSSYSRQITRPKKGVDVVVAGSQKALMCPPGLAFASVSERAFAAARAATSPRYYFDWERTRASQEKGENPFSPAVSLFRGLDIALAMILEDGLEAAYERHVRLGRACRAGVKAMGLELFSPDEDRSAVVTAIRMPTEVDGQAIVLAMRERSGVTIIGGQGEVRGKIVRIGHIGYVDVFDVTTALAALEVAMAEAGADIERAVAVTAALEAFAEPVTV